MCVTRYIFQINTVDFLHTCMEVKQFCQSSAKLKLKKMELLQAGCFSQYTGVPNQSIFNFAKKKTSTTWERGRVV